MVAESLETTWKQLLDPWVSTLRGRVRIHTRPGVSRRVYADWISVTLCAGDSATRLTRLQQAIRLLSTLALIDTRAFWEAVVSASVWPRSASTDAELLHGSPFPIPFVLSADASSSARGGPRRATVFRSFFEKANAFDNLDEDPEVLTVERKLLSYWWQTLDECALRGESDEPVYLRHRKWQIPIGLEFSTGGIGGEDGQSFYKDVLQSVQETQQAIPSVSIDKKQWTDCEAQCACVPSDRDALDINLISLASNDQMTDDVLSLTPPPVRFQLQFVRILPHLTTLKADDAEMLMRLLRLVPMGELRLASSMEYSGPCLGRTLRELTAAALGLALSPSLQIMSKPLWLAAGSPSNAKEPTRDGPKTISMDPLQRDGSTFLHLCSALPYSTSVKELRLQMRCRDIGIAHWQRLAYALFSCESNRSIRRITILGAELTADHVNAMLRVIRSSKPGRLLREEAVLFQEDINDYAARSPLTCSHPTHNITSVTIAMRVLDAVAFEAFIDLLMEIGQPIRHLSLRLIGRSMFAYPVVLEQIIRACPKLERLEVDGIQITQAQDIANGFNVPRCKLQALSLCDVGLTPAVFVHLMDALADKSHAISHLLTELSCMSLVDSSMDQSAVEACLAMLDKNHRLRCLELSMYPVLQHHYGPQLTAHNGDTLSLQRLPMPIKSRLAFMSVVRRKGPEDVSTYILSTDVLQHIFDYAAENAKRKIRLTY